MDENWQRSALRGVRVMHKQQHGMTTIGIVILLVFVAIAGFGVIQLVPVYLESMKIQQIMNQTKDKLDGTKASVPDIRKTLIKGVDMEGLREIRTREDFVISRTKNGFDIAIDYSRERSFVANVFLVAKFSHQVEVNR